jgi:hypothetical protein
LELLRCWMQLDCNRLLHTCMDRLIPYLKVKFLRFLPYLKTGVSSEVFL